MKQVAKKSGKRIILVCSGLVLVSIISAVMVYFTCFYRSPHSSPKEALTGCLLHLPDQFDMEQLGCEELEDLNLIDFIQTISREGYETALSLTLNDTNLSALSYGVGMEGLLSISHNKSDKLLNAEAGLYLYGMGGDIRLYATPETIMANSESFLPDSYVTASIEQVKNLKEVSGTPLKNILEYYQNASIPTEDLTTRLNRFISELTTHWHLTGTCTETSIDIRNESYPAYIYDAVSDLENRPQLRFYLTPDEQLLGMDIDGQDSFPWTITLRLGGEHPGEELYVSCLSGQHHIDLSITRTDSSGEAIYHLGLTENYDSNHRIDATVLFTLSVIDEAICAEFEDIHIALEQNDETYFMDCTGNLSITAGYQTLTMPSGHAYDLFTMTPEDLSRLKQTMTNNSTILFLLEKLPDNLF